MKTTIFTLCIIFIQQRLSKIGDHKPFCWSPDTFETTLQPSTKFLDIQKYEGKWYEIVRAKSIIEFRFICAENEGEIDVTINFTKTNGDLEVVDSKSIIKNDKNTRWNITFHYNMTGAYFILDFDDNYEWALVGEPCRDYFWILSKNPKLDVKIVNKLLKQAQDFGFDISKLIYRKDTCPQQISLM